MNLQPSEEQVLLRDMVRRFLADRTPAAELGRGPMTAADWQAMGELGLLAVGLPEAAGGMGGQLQDSAIIAEELGRAFAISPFAEGIMAATDLLSRGSGHDALLQAVAAGTSLIALAIGEFSDRDLRLTGSCRFARWAGEAQAFVVTDRTSAWLVEGNAAGLSREGIRLADGSTAATISLKQTPAKRLAVTTDDIARALALAEVGYVAEMVGAMATLFDLTADYSRQRKQFGAPIGSFQVVQHKLARMFVRLEQSRSMLLKAAVTDTGAPHFLRTAAAAKAYVAEAAQRVAEEAVQLHGGMGVTDELPVGRALRRILVLTRLFGRADEARAALAA